MFFELCDPCSGCPNCDPNLAYQQSFNFAWPEGEKICPCCDREQSSQYWKKNPQSPWPKKTIRDYGLSIVFSRKELGL